MSYDAARLSDMVASARTKEGRRAVFASLDREALLAAISADEPKTRKNAARLCGALALADAAEALCAQLAREDTRFVIPSQLLALGAIGGEKAQAALHAYAVPAAAGAEEERHVREIKLAKNKALSAFTAARAETVTKLPAPAVFNLLAPEGFAGVLAEELKTLGFSPLIQGDAVRVATDDLTRLFTARCFYEALLSVASGIPATPEAVKAAVGQMEGRYRIELRGEGFDRRRFISDLSLALGGGDSPSAYDTELRVTVENGRASVAKKLMNAPDTRFAYRLSALPASMKPALAAAIVRMCRPYQGAAPAKVFDPCCGSGTLLIERGLLSPCAALFGTDIDARAVRIAHENAAAADLRPTVIQKDCRRFISREPFQEIYCNLPFGNRVGTHADNEALYRALAARLPQLLADGGFAALYTMEGRLLESCIRHEKQLMLAHDLRTEAGGLYPHLFIVKKR